MIRYALICAKGHNFESWFANSAAYDKQVKRKLVDCPVCGDTKVEKAIMSPRLAGVARRGSGDAVSSADMPAHAAAGEAATANAPTGAAQDKVPVAIVSPQEREFHAKLRAIREHLTKNADYVGKKFPEEARKMHYGEADHRSIYGEASPQDAKELHDEGIEFHPLPVIPDERN
jgi:hypothetical protein